MTRNGGGRESGAVDRPDASVKDSGIDIAANPAAPFWEAPCGCSSDGDCRERIRKWEARVKELEAEVADWKRTAERREDALTAARAGLAGAATRKNMLAVVARMKELEAELAECKEANWSLRGEDSG